MDPTVWGPKMWFTLHTITFNYPEVPSNHHKKVYSDFFNMLQYIIPCEVCSKHYAQHLINNPILTSLDSKEKLVKWLINVHNDVNISLGKKVYSYDEVVDIYKKHYSKENNIKTESPRNIKKYVYSSLLVITILLLFYLYIRCFRKRKIFSYN